MLNLWSHALWVFWFSRGSVTTLTKWSGWDYSYLYMCHAFTTVKTALNSLVFDEVTDKNVGSFSWLTMYGSTAVFPGEQDLLHMSKENFRTATLINARWRMLVWLRKLKDGSRLPVSGPRWRHKSMSRTDGCLDVVLFAYPRQWTTIDGQRIHFTRTLIHTNTSKPCQQRIIVDLTQLITSCFHIMT